MSGRKPVFHSFTNQVVCLRSLLKFLTKLKQRCPQKIIWKFPGRIRSLMKHNMFFRLTNQWTINFALFHLAFHSSSVFKYINGTITQQQSEFQCSSNAICVVRSLDIKWTVRTESYKKSILITEVFPGTRKMERKEKPLKISCRNPVEHDAI